MYWMQTLLSLVSADTLWDTLKSILSPLVVLQYEPFTKWENRGYETFCAPLQDRVKLFAPPPLLKSGDKSGNFLHPPYNMAKTSSYSVKTTPSRFVAPPPPPRN